MPAADGWPVRLAKLLPVVDVLADNGGPPIGSVAGCGIVAGCGTDVVGILVAPGRPAIEGVEPGRDGLPLFHAVGVMVAEDVADGVCEAPATAAPVFGRLPTVARLGKLLSLLA